MLGVWGLAAELYTDTRDRAIDSTHALKLADLLLVGSTNADTNTDTNADTTPSRRVMDKSKMSDAAKTRVDDATKNLTDKRCLIEDTDESNHVEYAHCLPRSTNGPMASSL